jgi:hypothetical protein
VSVVGYQLQRAFVEGKSGQALLPLRKTFQLSPGIAVSSLLREVLYEVAHTFIEFHNLLRDRGFDIPNTDAISRWLNSPTFGSGGLGVQAFGVGGNVTRGSGPNTSAGFMESGFNATVGQWLRTCFPTRQAGGFVCVIDNLELLETSQAARALLESMRDTILNHQGLFWVLCGARGIVRTSASSFRLEGRLAVPMELKPVSDEDVAALISRRIELYSVVDGAVAPVGEIGFAYLYGLLNKNLRNALKFCEDFSFWLHEEGLISANNDEYFRLLEVWVTDQADRALAATTVGNRAWSVFDGLVNMNGSCSPSDFGLFDFNSPMAMRPQVKALEDANLVQSSIDDTDKRRKTIMVTPRGWLVRYARSGYSMPGDTETGARR